MAVLPVYASDKIYATHTIGGQHWHVHRPDRCWGEPCPLHHPSEHPLADAEIVMDRSGQVQRRCAHDVVHPDPDSMAYLRRQLTAELDAIRESTDPTARFSRFIDSSMAALDKYLTHECDGCCDTAFNVDPR